MFPFFEGDERAYTDEELEELKSDKENGIILTENEKYSLNQYISSESYKINDKLRRNIQLNESDKAMLTNLDNALDKIKDYKGNVVRTLYITNKDALNEFLDKNKLNEISSWNEYLSFSNRDNYNDKANVKIYVSSNKGKDIREYNKSESEILYKRNSKFITKNIVNKNDIYYIMWEEVNE